MECNKEEAVRAKEIAEKKLLERDITGARKFALKAHSLFRELEGLSQFIEIIDVYAAYEKKINGEADYYGIFGVDPFADDDFLKRKYRKMALSLHPDKNKSVGAEGAFQILSEAWNVLSDKDKRSLYNSKLNIRASSQTGCCSSSSAMYTTTAANPRHVPTRPMTQGTATCQQDTLFTHRPRNTTSGTSSQHFPVHQQTRAAAAAAMGSEFIATPPGPTNPAPPVSNQYSSFRNPEVPARYQKPPAPATAAQYNPVHGPSFHPHYTPLVYQPTPTSHPSKPETFWTMCNRCGTKFEYQKIFLNQILMCNHCKEPFMSTEVPAPNVSSGGRNPRPWPFPHLQDMHAATSGSRGVPASATRIYKPVSLQPSSKPSQRRHGETTNMARDNEILKKTSSTVPDNVEGVAASTVSGLNKEKAVKRRRTNGQKYESAKEGTGGKAGSSTGIKRASAHLKRNFGAGQESMSVKELSQIEIRAMLMARAKREILGRLKDWETEKSKSSHPEKVETVDSQRAPENVSVDHPREDQSRVDIFSDTKNTSQLQKSSTPEETDDVDANPDETVSMMVPDANFHNFDEERVEVSFNENQVWAAYDDDDGMPRYYALVHQVISRKPFKMQIKWLNSKSSAEFGSLDWIDFGFTKTSGDFRVGKSAVSKRLNSFSHPVKWKKGPRGAIQIYPTKGDAWALYRNWSPDWDEATADEIIHVYDLVMVLQDYNEDNGVLVAPLVKVAGFTSIFNQISDHKEIRIIPREEMFRFSHQVPCYMLNGLEADNVPKGCYELDPAALPLELLKVMTDAEAAEQRVSENPGTLRGSEVVTEATPESTSTEKVNATERSGIQEAKNVLTYSRKKQRKEEGK